MKKRTFHYIYDEEFVQADDQHSGTTKDAFTFKKKEVETPSDDLVSEDMILIVFPISCLFHVGSILRMFNLKDDVFYFFQQCKDVIAVPEEHQDDKGQGKMNFQSFFLNVPHSMYAGNPNALIIVGLEPVANNEGKPRDYHLAGYMHLNRFNFKPDPNSDKIEPGYYFNMLRISQRMENGVEVYRRKKLFSLFFSISHTMVVISGIEYIYAAMGNENVKIKEALKRSSEMFGLHHERIPFKIYGKVSWFSGSSKAAKQLIDITDDPILMRQYYDKVQEKMGRFLFYPYLSFEAFMDTIKKLTAYSKSTRVWMVKNEQGEMGAATIAMNWGEFFLFLMQNPKGIFKLLSNLKLTDKILYLIASVGDLKSYTTLQNGLMSYYLKNHGVKWTFLPSYTGDPFLKARKSFIDDNYVFFVIPRHKEKLDRFKEISADTNGNPRLFIDQPIP